MKNTSAGKAERLVGDERAIAPSVDKFSQEYYSYYIKLCIRNNLSYYTREVYYGLSNDIINLISDFCRAFRCIYLCERGHRMRSICQIGRLGDELHLTNSSFTVSVWIKLKYSYKEIGTSDQGDQCIVGCRDLLENETLHITIRKSSPHMGFYNNDITAFGYKLNKNIWYHLAFVYNYKLKKQFIYVNGSLIKYKLNANCLKGGQRELFISHYFNGRPLFGWLTELQIWNVARSEKEIQQFMYKFDINEKYIQRYINCNGNIILRKYFTVNKNMKWVQKIKNDTQRTYDHLFQYV